MGQKVPDWLDNNILTECLQHEEGNENLTVTSFTASEAAPAGNNFGSVVLRVRLQYVNGNEKGDKSLIVKTQHFDGPMLKMVEIIEFQEPVFYYKFIPEIRKLIDISLVPKSFFSPRPYTVFLEDLNEEGFVMVDRTKKLDFDHCRLYVTAAASMQAASFVLFQQQREFTDLFEKGHNFSKPNVSSMMKGVLSDAIKALFAVVEKTDSLKRYVDVLKTIPANLWDTVVKCYKPNEKWNTIIQSDSWLTNMMFKYNDKGTVTDIKLLDFQEPKIGNPLTDLIVFLWSSSNSDVKRHRLHDLYKIYTDTFNARLEEMDYPERLPYEFVIEGVKRLSPVAFQTAVTFICVMHESVSFDLEDIFAVEENEKKGTTKKNMFEKYFDDKFCTFQLPDILVDLESAGIFDFLKNISI